MSEFTRGALWTVGMYLFGKGMYDLGKQKQQKVHAKMMKDLANELNEFVENLKREKEEESD